MEKIIRMRVYKKDMIEYIKKQRILRDNWFNEGANTMSKMKKGRKKIVLIKGKGKQPYYFNIISGNGEIIATAEGYSAKQMSKQTAKSLIEDPPTALYEIDKKTGKEVKIW